MSIYLPGPNAKRGEWNDYGAWETTPDGKQCRYHPEWPKRFNANSWYSLAHKDGLETILANGEWVPLYPLHVRLPDGI